MSFPRAGDLTWVSWDGAVTLPDFPGGMGARGIPGHSLQCPGNAGTGGTSPRSGIAGTSQGGVRGRRRPPGKSGAHLICAPGPRARPGHKPRKNPPSQKPPKQSTRPETYKKIIPLETTKNTSPFPPPLCFGGLRGGFLVGMFLGGMLWRCLGGWILDGGRGWGLGSGPGPRARPPGPGPGPRCEDSSIAASAYVAKARCPRPILMWHTLLYACLLFICAFIIICWPVVETAVGRELKSRENAIFLHIHHMF